MGSGNVGVIRIFLVCEPALLRDAIGSLVNASPDFLVTTQAGRYSDVLVAGGDPPADVILLHLSENHEGFLKVVSLLTTNSMPGVLVIASRADWETTLQAIRLGAAGVVHVDEPGLVLLKAIQQVSAGELWLNHSQTSLVIKELRRSITAAPGRTDLLDCLTRRELEIVALVAHGLRTPQLAQRLNISEKTVRNHFSSIYEKLGVVDRAALALLAVRLGLSTPISELDQLDQLDQLGRS